MRQPERLRVGTPIDSSRWARRLQRLFPWIAGGHSPAPSLGRDEAGQASRPVGEQIVAATSRNRCLVLTVCVFLLLAVGLVFGQSLRHEFVNYDYDGYVYQTPQISGGLSVAGIVWVFSHRHVGNWHPLTGLSHMLDCQFYGLSAGGHHLTNALLHAATAVVLFLVLWQMTGGFWPSALVATIFAVHPLRVESVAWVSERKDVLSGLCFVLTLAAYVRYVRRPFSLGRYLLVVALFALGLMAKPMLVTLPLVLLLLDYWPLGRFAGSLCGGLTPHPDQKGASGGGTNVAEADLGRFLSPGRLVVEKLPLLLLTAISCVITVWAQGTAVIPVGHLQFWQRACNALVSYATYLGQFVCPQELAALYPHPGANLPIWKVVGAGALLAGISAAALAGWRRRPYLVVGWLWYLGILAPVIGVTQTGLQARADRFTYLPQIGLYVALVWGAVDVCRSWPYRRWLYSATATLVLVAVMVCAWRQTSFWHDSQTLWSHALECTSRNAVAHNNLGCAFASRGQFDAAMLQFRRVLEFDPDDAEAHNNLGSALASRGQFDAAAVQFQRVLAIKPDDAGAHNSLGKALACLGQIDEAAAHYRRALEIQPDDADAHNNLGIALAASGRFAEAIAHYRKALETWPDYPDASYHLGIALANCGQFEEAWARLQPALKARPNDATLQSTLGNIMAARGEFQDAVAHYRKALQIRPDDLAAQRNLAWLRATCPLASQRNGEEAVELAERANRRCDGRRPEVLDTLAAAYAELGWFPEAVAAEGKALELASQQHAQPLIDVIRVRMALYQARKPFRQPPVSAPPKHKA